MTVSESVGLVGLVFGAVLFGTGLGGVGLALSETLRMASVIFVCEGPLTTVPG